MVVLPILTISATILQVYKRDLIQQTTDRTLQTLHAVKYSIEQEINNVVTFSAAIGMDTEVLELLVQRNSSICIIVRKLISRSSVRWWA
jgi:two-component system sensor histidine kinase YesM